MNFLSMFKKTSKTGKDSTIGSEELMDGTTVTAGDEEIETALSLHPSWQLPQEQEYVFRFLANELETLKPNQISLSGIDIDVEPATGDFLVKALFRSSLDQTISVGEVELMLMDQDGKTIGSQQFDLNELGEIAPRSARPWVFVFTKDNLFVEEPPAENWTLAFNVQSMVPHKLELEESWQKGLPAEQKVALEEIVSNLPKLKPREVNIAGFQVLKQDDGSIAASVFIRNGHSKQINIEKLPLELIDASGEMVASGSFDIGSLPVNANTTKPWTFIYPKDMVTKDDPDFSRWTIRIPQQDT